MKQTITQVLALFIMLALNAGNGKAQQTVLFHETFNNLTTDNTTKNALDGGLTDETGYVVGGGGSAMLCAENGTMNLTGGRFKTKTLDLSGEDVVLYVTYKKGAGGDAKRFQIDMDKEGTSGLGGLMSETASNAPVDFETREIPLTGGTSTSFIHFRTESDYTIVFNEIKIVKGKELPEPAITSFVVAGVNAAINEEAGTITAELPAGSDATSLVPVVGMNAGGDHYTPAGAQNFTAPVIYTVYNVDGSKHKAYTVTLTVAVTLSDDATLSDIKYKGVTIAGFAAATTEYSIELPYGSAVPATTDVTATATHPHATVGTITRSSDTFPTDITIPLTAENETATASYVLHFTQKPASTDATLKTIKVNGNAITLEANKTEYTIDLPYTTTEVPTVEATANDSKATVTIIPAADLQGQTRIDVTAEDGVTTKQYIIHFNVLPIPTVPVTTWNFSEFPLGDINGTFDGLSIVDNRPDGSAVTIDENSKSMDGFTFTKRLKLGGGGFEPSTDQEYSPTRRYISFKVSGKSDITLYAVSSSASAGTGDRKLIVSDNTQILHEFEMLGGSTVYKLEYEYTGEAATIYLYSRSSGINFYAILATNVDTGNAIKDVKLAKEIKSVSYYDMLGRPLNVSAQGLVIVKTIYTDGTVSSYKTYRLDK